MFKKRKISYAKQMRLFSNLSKIDVLVRYLGWLPFFSKGEAAGTDRKFSNFHGWNLDIHAFQNEQSKGKGAFVEPFASHSPDGSRMACFYKIYEATMLNYHCEVVLLDGDKENPQLRKVPEPILFDKSSPWVSDRYAFFNRLKGTYSPGIILLVDCDRWKYTTFKHQGSLYVISVEIENGVFWINHGDGTRLDFAASNLKWKKLPKV